MKSAKYSLPETIGVFQVVLDGQAIEYTLKHSRRARYARLQMGRDGELTVFIPRLFWMERIPDLLHSKVRWILKHRLHRESQADPEKAAADSLPYLGGSLRLVLRQSPAANTEVKLDGKSLMVYLADGAALHTVIQRWYRQQAQRYLERRLAELSARMSLEFNRLTVRQARTRWGSCSLRGNISLNWKLMALPAPVIDYVMIHELAHLKHMDHSGKFWELVAKHCPDWRQHRQSLKQSESILAKWERGVFDTPSAAR